jgi:hypothetical protein
MCNTRAGTYNETVDAPWTVFWYGMPRYEQTRVLCGPILSRRSRCTPSSQEMSSDIIKAALLRPGDIIRPAALPADAKAAPAQQQQQQRGYHTSAAALHATGAGGRVRVGLVGARGYTGVELLRILGQPPRRLQRLALRVSQTLDRRPAAAARNPHMELAVASSRSLKGRTVEVCTPAERRARRARAR